MRPEDFNEPAKNNLPIPAVRDKDGTGYDILSLLLKERIILVQGEVNTGMAVNIIAQLKFLENQSADEPITMLVNSPGGSVIDGLAIYDVMRSVTCKITTIGNGMQASMGSILMAGGDKRLMSDNAKLMIHSLSSGTRGKVADQLIGLDFSQRLFDELKAVYVGRIGLTPEFWDLICAQDTWLSTDQALKLGYIHGKVDAPEAKQDPYAGAANAFLKAKQDKREAQIENLSTAELVKLLTVTASDDGLGERLRPEIIVELSQRPEFWTEALKAQKAAAAPVNDNTKVEAPASKRKKQAGPNV